MTRLSEWSILSVRAFLHVVTFCGIFAYCMWLWIDLAPDYEFWTGGLGDDTLSIYYASGGDFKGTIVFHGYYLAQVAWMWIPVLVAIFAVALLNALPSSNSSADTRATNLIRRISLRVRALFVWEAPICHKFWVYWCGGLSTIDILIVLTYIAVHATWMHWLVKRDNERFAAFEEAGLSLPHSVSLLKLEKYALNFGVILWPTLMVLFFPMAHISFISDWCGVHYASMIRWHRWLGHGTMWILSLHGILYYIFWGAIHDFWAYFIDWSKMYSINNFAGSLGWFFGLALWATSIQWVRRNFFEIFYRFHIVNFILFVIFSTIHYAGAWTWWLPGLLVYAIDVVLRAGQSVNATTIAAYPAENGAYTTIEVEFAKGSKVRPNEEVFVLIPQISHWQWHPFTIVNVLPAANGNPKAILHCKIYNAWTTELFVRSKQSNKLAARVAGPIGRCRNMGLWEDYQSVILIGGGIGAIPVIATLNEIRKKALEENAVDGKSVAPPKPLKKVVFVWVSRHGDEFSVLDDEMLQFVRDCDWLQVSFHITSPERDLSKLGKEGVAVDPKWLPLTHHWASPLKLSPNRPAQARLGGLVLEVLTASLVFLGAFFGTMLGMAFAADGSFSGKDLAMGFYWQTGIIELATQTVMALGLPYALLVLPVTLFNAWRDRLANERRGMESDRDSASDSNNGKGLKADPGLEGFVSQMTKVQYGRPDIYSIVTAAIGTGKENVGVFCGGPDTMRQAVNNATYSMRQKFNLFGRLVHYHDESHEL